jgi:hypothetical protein
MSRAVQYLAVALIGSTALAAWVLHHGAGAVAGAENIDPAPHKKFEIVRVAPASQPAPPATQAATQPTARIVLPPEFAIFQTRNVFAHGKGGASAAGPAGPEAGFILRGVVQAEDRLIAFVEDKAGNRVIEVTSGQAIARGKVVAVNLDGFEYQGVGGVKQIKVGQDLSGQIAPPTPTSKPAAPKPAPGEGPPPGEQPGGPMRVRHGPPRGEADGEVIQAH